MWILTPLGFFSIVQKPEDKNSGTLTVRARVRSDLENLRKTFLPGMGEIVADAGTDYRYRARAPRGEVGIALANLVLGIDYANFKNQVAKVQGKKRAAIYSKLWSVLHDLSDDDVSVNQAPLIDSAVKKPSKNLQAAYGGILVDDAGRILMREPKGHFDGYVWTFPKGKADPDESPEQAALREVLEETGYSAQIVSKLPGSFSGGTSVTEYFLMKPVGKPVPFDAETKAVRWVTLDEAGRLISKTTNPKGRERDLAVLKALRAIF